MKFGAVYCIYDDHEYIDISLFHIKNELDKVLFLISDVPWNGKKTDNSKTIEVIQKLCKENSNFQLIQGHWTNEITQRNFGLELFYKEGIDYCFIIDSDEIYSENHFKNIKQFILQNKNITAFHIQWNTYWKKDYYIIQPREYYNPVICVKVENFNFTTIRHGQTNIIRTGGALLTTQQNSYNGVVIPEQVGICYHLSYARDNEYMKRKLETNSHAPEFIFNWYNNVWENWKPQNKNLHPVSPKQYNQAVKEDFLNFPDALKVFIKGESCQKTCSIIILNWNSNELLNRCLSLIKKNTRVSYEIIVVDNGTQKKQEFKQIIEKFNIKKITENVINEGFSKGVNQGISLANGNNICLMNVDAEPQENWLENMYETMIVNPNAGIIGPLGNEIESEYQKEGMVSKDCKVMNVHFYCTLIFKEVIQKIGLLDTRFGFGGYEDNDFCIRAGLAGYECIISAKSLVKHKAHQVFKLNNLDNTKIEQKNKTLLESKLIQALYNYGENVDLFKLSTEIAKKSGLIIEEKN